MFPGIFLPINLISLAVYSSTPYKNGHPALTTAAAFAAWATQSKSFFDFIGKCFGWIMVLGVWAVILYCMSLMVRFLTYIWDTVLSIFARPPSSHPPATVETPCEPYKEPSASLPTPPPSPRRLSRPLPRQPPLSPLITSMPDSTKYYWQRPHSCTHASCKAGAIQLTKCEKGGLSLFMKEQWDLASPSTSKDSSSKSDSPETLSPLVDTSTAELKDSMRSFIAPFAELPSTLLSLLRLFICPIVALYSALTPEQWRKVYANLLVLLAVHLWSAGGEAPKMREYGELDVLSYHLVPDVQHWGRWLLWRTEVMRRNCLANGLGSEAANICAKLR